ncbi:MAG: hypothetical protein DMG79_15285 [Acidobacteria bacterium]|nr:MAG: hypothetical protein DMG79_15285 [Acidobacteriota bacterium]
MTRHIASLSAAGFLLIAFLFSTLPSNNEVFAASKPKGKPYALIAGTVWGPDDRPVYGVVVKIRRAKDKKPKWEVSSDHMGEFAQRVPAGESDYILSADLKGFKPVNGKPLRLVQEVTVHIYGDEREDTGLHLTF